MTFPWPPENLREVVLEQDAICVSGGNTANMLAIWRVHGIDTLMREAWEKGIVLWGASAGMICWFEAGVTDSFGPQLAGHGMPRLPAGQRLPALRRRGARRPRYRELVADGLPAGIAADDGVALHYVGTELRRSSRAGRAPPRTASTRDGEERLEPREL